MSTNLRAVVALIEALFWTDEDTIDLLSWIVSEADKEQVIDALRAEGIHVLPGEKA